MRKAKIQQSVDLSPAEIWEKVIAVKDLPSQIKFMKAVIIDRPLAKGVIWYDVTTILGFPMRVKHLTTEFEPRKYIHFHVPLVFGGRMYQIYDIQKVEKGSLLTAEISFDLGNVVANRVIGPFLQKRLQHMLEVSLERFVSK